MESRPPKRKGIEAGGADEILLARRSRDNEVWWLKLLVASLVGALAVLVLVLLSSGTFATTVEAAKNSSHTGSAGRPHTGTLTLTGSGPMGYEDAGTFRGDGSRTKC